MLSRSRSVSGPRWSPSGDQLAWIESFDGRADLMVAPAGPGGDLGGPPVVVTAEGGVGGGFAWVGDDLLVVAAADGRLALVHAGGGVERFLSRDGRALAPVVSTRGEVACAIERDDACDIATVPLDGSAWPERVSLADYAWDPEWSPDGGTLVWQEWDLPNMPWHASRLVRREGLGVRCRRRMQSAPLLAGRHATRVGERRQAHRRRRGDLRTRGTRVCGAGMVAGPTFLRVVTRERRARMVPQ